MKGSALEFFELQLMGEYDVLQFEILGERYESACI